MKERLRNYSGLQETKDAEQINAICDSEWDPLAVNILEIIYKIWMESKEEMVLHQSYFPVFDDCIKLYNNVPAYKKYMLQNS